MHHKAQGKDYRELKTYGDCKGEEGRVLFTYSLRLRGAMISLLFSRQDVHAYKVGAPYKQLD
jgi:hypothetical protein